jgi:tRNA pseudouridine55 synthase
MTSWSTSCAPTCASNCRTASEPVDGVLLRAKPAGVTSHDVVAEVRRSLPRKTKVGHAGTLDPFATGLLIVLVGRAARAQRFFMELPKTYRAVARLGWTSTTGDRDGDLDKTGRMPESLAIPVGPQLQTPPAYSAVKVGGRRAYDLARAGETPDLKARPITVHRAELLWHEGDRAAFEIECSSGTYVRSLVTDLGDAYCDELERTAVGPFRLEDVPRAAPAGAAADPAAQDPAAGLLPLRDALAFLPERTLSAEEAAAVRNGRRVEAHGGVAEHLRLTLEGELLAIAEPRDGELQPVVVFAPA